MEIERPAKKARLTEATPSPDALATVEHEGQKSRGSTTTRTDWSAAEIAILKQAEPKGPRNRSMNWKKVIADLRTAGFDRTIEQCRYRFVKIGCRPQSVFKWPALPIDRSKPVETELTASENGAQRAVRDELIALRQTEKSLREEWEEKKNDAEALYGRILELRAAQDKCAAFLTSK